ncbi:UNVERIFIED_CONTAM: hypothetical protein GTU68_050817 [Idotea baltica]|nr:hypothetical protein [Idotea baltica]
MIGKSCLRDHLFALSIWELSIIFLDFLPRLVSELRCYRRQVQPKKFYPTHPMHCSYRMGQGILPQLPMLLSLLRPWSANCQYLEFVSGIKF